MLGFVWLVTTQEVVPLTAERLEGEVLLVRLGALERPYAREELERFWRRGRFPLTNDSTGWKAYIGDHGCSVVPLGPTG